MKKSMIALLVLAAMGSTACSRIETGEVGLRVGFDKQVQTGELMPGSFNQTFVGDVLKFQVRDIGVDLQDMKPQTSDNSTLADFDMMVIYSVTPTAVSDLYTTKARAFHAENEHGETFLMYNYMMTVARNAAYKAVGGYPAMDTVRNRDAIEAKVLEEVRKTLTEEKLDGSLVVSQVQIRNIQPAQSIVNSANAAISKQNELVAKQKEVEIAAQEAKRQELLSRPANLEYMKVQAELNISEGIRDGKVQTIVVPHNFTMLGGVK